MQLLIFLNGKKSSAGGRHRIAPVPTAARLIINSSWGKMTTPSKSVSISAFSLSCSVCVTMGKSISKAWHINLRLALRQITLLSSERKLFDWCQSKAAAHLCTYIRWHVEKCRWRFWWAGETQQELLDVREHKFGIFKSPRGVEMREIRLLKHKLAPRN